VKAARPFAARRFGLHTASELRHCAALWRSGQYCADGEAQAQALERKANSKQKTEATT